MTSQVEPGPPWDHRLPSGIQWYLVASWPPALTEKVSARGQHAQGLVAALPRLGEPDVASMEC